MTITPLAFNNSGVPLATDNDLKVVHPGIIADLWQGETNYSAQLERAWDMLSIDLRNKGFEASLISNSAANIAWAKEAVIQRAFMDIFLDFTRIDGDRWHLLYLSHKDIYQKYLGNVRLDYDSDEDGTVSEDEKETTSQVSFTR